MKLYVATRVVSGLIVVAAIVVVMFFLMRLLPGDPIKALVGDFPAPPEYVEEIRRRFGLDRPLLEQFTLYVGQLLQGNLGYSFLHGEAVLPMLLRRAAFSMALIIPSLIIANVIGVALAVAAARRAGTAADAGIRSLSLLAFSIPVFWMAQMLIVVFAIQLRILPAQGVTSPGGHNDLFALLTDVLAHSIMPVFVVSTHFVALVAIVGRASVLDALQENFVLTARAKGLSPNRVLWRHVLPAAAGPIVTVIGYQWGQALTGTILAEAVFAWPGLGSAFVSAIASRDHPVLLGIFLLASISVVVANLIADLVHAKIDPRIRTAAT